MCDGRNTPRLRSQTDLCPHLLTSVPRARPLASRVPVCSDGGRRNTVTVRRQGHLPALGTACVNLWGCEGEGTAPRPPRGLGPELPVEAPLVSNRIGAWMQTRRPGRAGPPGVHHRPRAPQARAHLWAPGFPHEPGTNPAGGETGFSDRSHVAVVALTFFLQP